MPKKFIDIYPPKQFDDSSLEDALSKETSSLRKRDPSFLTKKLWFGLPLLLIPFLALHFFFAEAEITIHPQVTEVHITEQLIAQVGQQGVDLGQKRIPAKLFDQAKDATKSFPASGKEEREERAGGTIRVINENPAAQTLVASTRFISEDGKLFRSVERVSIPGASGGQSGSLDVEVVAAEPGAEYNIGPSNFSLPGLAGTELYTKVYGKSSVAMSGGAIGEVSVVTKEDIQTAKEQLLQELEVDAKATLLSRIPPNYMILESSMETELVEDNSLVQEGAALDAFTYTASLKVSTLAFAKEDALLLARHLFESYLQEDQTIKDDSFQVGYTVEASNPSTGRMVLTSDISAESYTHVDLRSLESKFQGVSRQEVVSILNTFPSLATAELSLWPFWVQKVPNDQSRVQVELSL